MVTFTVSLFSFHFFPQLFRQNHYLCLLAVCPKFLKIASTTAQEEDILMGREKERERKRERVREREREGRERERER